MGYVRKHDAFFYPMKSVESHLTGHLELIKIQDGPEKKYDDLLFAVSRSGQII